jgi:hypothetical protein
MKPVALFGITAGLSYFGASLIGEKAVIKALATDNPKEYLDIELKARKYQQFDSYLSDCMEMSQVSWNQEKKTLKFLYIPKTQAQGYPGISHGGFTYSISTLLAEEYQRLTGDTGRAHSTYIRYNAPIKVENVHSAEVSKDKDQIKVIITDKTDKKCSTFIVSV